MPELNVDARSFAADDWLQVLQPRQNMIPMQQELAMRWQGGVESLQKYGKTYEGLAEKQQTLLRDLLREATGAPEEAKNEAESSPQDVETRAKTREDLGETQRD